MAKEIPTHYDKFGRIINVGATILVASSFDGLYKRTVKSVAPIMIRADSGELHYPCNVVVWLDG
jgi:hypothetical protein